MTAATESDDRHENVAEGVPHAGDIVAGSYHVDRVIGQGGMGVVLAAHHGRLGHTVAIKVLYLEAVGDQAALGRFLREAQAALQIRGEHVARVFDVGALDSGAPYMVMEMLDGADLEQLVERSGPLPLAVAVDYVLQAGEALAEAHALGIVHRDIKPSNLFLTDRADGTALVKVLDFGIAKRVTGAGPEAALTMTGTALGTPAYMAPEQIRNAKGVDSRADIWGLGAALYHLLAGEPPFYAPTLPAVCAMIVADPTPSIRAARPDLPESFERVMRRCLEKDPASRFQHLGELAQALAPFAPASAVESIGRIARILSARGAQPSEAAAAKNERDRKGHAGARGPHDGPAPRGPFVADEVSVDGSLDVTVQKPLSTPPPHGAASPATPSADDRRAREPSTIVMQETLTAPADDDRVAGLPAPTGRKLAALGVAAGLVIVALLIALAIGGGGEASSSPSSSESAHGATDADASPSARGPRADVRAGASAAPSGEPAPSASEVPSAGAEPAATATAAARATATAPVGRPRPTGTPTGRATATTSPAPTGKAKSGSADDGVLGDRK